MDMVDEVLRLVYGDNMSVVANDKAIYTNEAVIHEALEVKAGTGRIRTEVMLA